MPHNCEQKLYFVGEKKKDVPVGVRVRLIREKIMIERENERKWNKREEKENFFFSCIRLIRMKVLHENKKVRIVVDCVA